MKKNLFQPFFAIILAFAGLDTAQAQQLLQNGNFNGGATSWVTACINVEATYYETTYGGTVSTNHVAEVDDGSCFYQDVCILPGSSYVFSMDASRRTAGGAPSTVTTHIDISGLDATGAIIGTYVAMDFSRSNTTFALTAVTGIPLVTVPSASTVVRLRVKLTDNTSGYSTLGMIVDNLSLTFSTPPAVVALDTTCQNTPDVFSVSSVATTGIDYVWNFGAIATPSTSASATPSVTWSATGSMPVTAALGNGVCYVDTVAFNVYVAPPSNTVISDTICSDFPYTFGSATLDSTGTYIDTFTSASGCDSIVTLNLFVKPEPAAPVITGDTFYCQGATFVPFIVTGTGTITWYTTPIGGVGTTTAPVVPVGVPGVYTYYASQVLAGCEGPRDSIRVVVNLTPAAPVAGDVTYCQYVPTVPLTATGTNILWYTVPTGGVGTTTAPTPSSAVPGVFFYYVSQTNNTCEGPRATVTVTINATPSPPVVVDVPDNYCPGQPFNTWTISTGTGILWYAAASGGVGTATPPVVNTSVPGTYTWWVSQTVLGCESDRSSAAVTVYDGVTASFTHFVKYGCTQDTLLFNNLSAGAVNYQWSFGDGTSSTLSNPTHIYTAQALYTVKLFAHSYTCVDSSIQTIDLRHPNTASFTIAPDLLCQGLPAAFTNTSTATTPSYAWSFGDGNNSTVANPSHIYNNTGTYTVTLVVTDFVPCADTAFGVVTVDTASAFNVWLSDTSICSGTYISMSGNFSHIGNTGLVWNFGDGDSVKNVNPVSYAYHAPGVYTLTTTVAYRACPSTTYSRNLTVHPQPQIYLGVDTSMCAGGPALVLSDKLNSINSAGYAWLWNTGQTTPSIAVTSPGDYVATVTMQGGCVMTDTITVSNGCYVNLPNVFTPNGDGVNDYFNPRDYLSGLRTFNFSVYNRWGQLIFSTSELAGRGWDGNFNDIAQPQGVYVYTLSATFNDGQKLDKKGNITLIK